MAFLQPSPGRAVRGQGQVTGASLQCRVRRGDRLTSKHQGAVSLAASSPHQHASGKVCRQMGQLGGVSPGQGLLLVSHGACYSAPNPAPRGRAGGALWLQGTRGARRSPALLPGTSQEYSPAPQAGWYHCSLLQVRLTRGAAEQGCLQEPRTQSPTLQSRSACQQHSSLCHMWGQAAHQLPNPAAPPHPIRGDKHREAVAAPPPPPPARELGVASARGDGQGTATFPVHGSCSAARR